MAELPDSDEDDEVEDGGWRAGKLDVKNDKGILQYTTKSASGLKTQDFVWVVSPFFEILCVFLLDVS